ncbi:MAG: tRNA (adenosine(37)-N6)-threonylcarbamoyltransferase complex ATPase subunit type 1 TsaE [Deltaproteobacteria bacterium]|nr:tRNA (adenosine(37)-N6)-threonylcarbamoyltransferase complex ATPase subunit type 1 TsaE [Deltaproteobacteria bacterium]
MKKISPDILLSKSPNDTIILGKIIAKNLKRGDLVALLGELGAGKTCLVKGIALGLGVPEDHLVVSPTFTIINEYNGKIPLFHFDLYRLDTISDMESIGYEDYFYGDGITCIEWADRIKEVLPDKYLKIEMEWKEENERIIKVSGENKYNNIANRIKEEYIKRFKKSEKEKI